MSSALKGYLRILERRSLGSDLIGRSCVNLIVRSQSVSNSNNFSPRMHLNDEQEALDQLSLLIRDEEIVHPITDELLLCFLRARKYEVKRALRALKNYMRLFDQNPDLMANLETQDLKTHLNQRLQVVASDRDQLGRKIFIFRAGLWTPKVTTLDDIFRCNVFYLRRLASDLETQFKGIVAIVDLKNLGIHHVRQVTPSYAKKVAALIQDCFPIRFQAIHLVNEPWIFSILLSMILPFFSEKIQSRIYHHGNCWASLHSHIDADVLPQEYGGSQPLLDQTKPSDEFLNGATNFFDFNNNKQ